MILAERDCTIRFIYIPGTKSVRRTVIYRDTYIGFLNLVLSCGNFHGEYPAKTLDILAIGIHEIASISERRIERFCNPKSSGEGQDSLPAFLAPLGKFIISCLD